MLNRQRERNRVKDTAALLAVPQGALPGPLDLAHQLEHTIEKGFGCWRAAWDVDCGWIRRDSMSADGVECRIAAFLLLTVDWHDTVASTNNRVAVMVVSTAVCARSHGNDPSWLRHLVVYLSQSWCHLVCQCAGDDHDVGLSRRCSEHHTKTILVVSCSGNVHHLYGAASESESHGPQRALTSPVDNLVHRREDIFCSREKKQSDEQGCREKTVSQQRVSIMKAASIR